MAYLLDTNILSDVVRNPEGRTSQRVERAGSGNVFTSIVVAAELRFGALKSGSARLASRIEALLRQIDVASFEAPMDVVYAEARRSVEKAGTPIGRNDMLIAAHALATESILVTDNVNEFSRVPGLKIENWLR
jgi:tRNA(fMet)-specific endonuclease VapC